MTSRARARGITTACRLLLCPLGSALQCTAVCHPTCQAQIYSLPSGYGLSRRGIVKHILVQSSSDPRREVPSLWMAEALPVLISLTLGTEIWKNFPGNVPGESESGCPLACAQTPAADDHCEAYNYKTRCTQYNSANTFLTHYFLAVAPSSCECCAKIQ